MEELQELRRLDELQSKAAGAPQDTPRKASSLPQDQRSLEAMRIPSSKGNPSFRQGSVADMDPRPLAEQWHSTVTQGPPTYTEHQIGQASSLPSRAIDKLVSLLPTGIGSASSLPSKALEPALAPYNEKVVSKSRETLFGPPTRLDYTASPGDLITQNSKDVWQTMLSDPLMLGGALFAGARVRVPTRQAGQPGVPITTPVVTVAPPLRQVGEPLLGAPAPRNQPSIQDLAQQSPAAQHQKFESSARPTDGSEPFASQRSMTLGMRPTGSIERSLGPESQADHAYFAPSLRTLPTGSLLRISSPELETV